LSGASFIALPLRGRAADYNLLIRAGRPTGRGWNGGADRPAQANTNPGGMPMNLPKIDISALPDLDTLTGVFGSLVHPARAIESDDSVIIIMVFVYEVLVP
jgi:hypothetical protein